MDAAQRSTTITKTPKPNDTAIEISVESHLKLQELSRIEQRSMTHIVNELIHRYEDEQFWKRARESLAELKADPVAWQEYLDEIELWESTSMDGLEDEEPYYTPEELDEILAAAAASEND